MFNPFNLETILEICLPNFMVDPFLEEEYEEDEEEQESKSSEKRQLPDLSDNGDMPGEDGTGSISMCPDREKNS